MNGEMKAKITFGVWGFIIGAAIAMIIGFKWGGWTTSDTTQKKSDAAVLANQAAICVAQYINQPDSQKKLKEYEAIDSYQRYEFIEKGGWDKMPGQKEASYGVRDACVEGLDILIKK